MIKWPSPAKLNLFLYIIGRRLDGYHMLQTLFQFINYGDDISISITNNGKINLFSSMVKIKNKYNLIMRAARLLQLYCWQKNKKNVLGANIYLNKVLPIGGGLGGGSSNAATTLIALNKQWRTRLSLKTLAKLGLRLGSDIPAFIYGHTSIVEGIGEILTPMNYAKKWYLVLILPISISTHLIFNHKELTRNSIHSPIVNLLNKPFHNDCESLVRKKFPIIDQYIAWLSKYAPTRLTGTGSCIFAEFNDKNSAIEIQKIVSSETRNFIAQGINVSPLHRMLP
ncbi:4-(cytidine 5'-diphospho)-2-C-methyl-D-erythritol kinase [Blochmannia endosymbiont of Colobopsis nipponica]|uniref:4-(cytidine 5'-diphospho)-2-C-methyl-D-erythritol kinase n=1 Tax=Blochmannia endosymbiont of Colobopsis nipponica TaxID=2681987 RepID=UPI001785608C|nr:4-(cytidine 5'-diphospho)-2-C-methyl-D-erythritol kinase [Blochmannia endosymbiont of Colobopsis nipponica]QOI11097.1 4-(cytidine 5'-diphospho)-2-C-methyl-D-erythritol kinase [Blochmannia endosymbiont of Colobopsis nipponica]